MIGVKIDPADERAVVGALNGLARRGLMQGAIDRDDLKQEMLVALWRQPRDDPKHKAVIARSAGIDYVRRILGRNGQKRATEYTDEPPDISSGESDAPDLWLQAKQEIERVMRPKIETPARKRPVGAPDPRALQIIPGPPPAPLPPVRSAWAAVWESLEPGGSGVALTTEQALAFAAWARAHKCKITRRRINGGTYGVWRV